MISQLYQCAEPSGEPEPPVARVLKFKFFGGGPVTAVVRRKVDFAHVWQCRFYPCRPSTTSWLGITVDGSVSDCDAEMTENPFESPLRENALANTMAKLARSRLWSAMLGTIVGLFVGIVATVVLWSIRFAPLVWLPAFSAAFAFTGLIVGVTRRLPLLVGGIAGVASIVVCIFVLAERPSLQSGWMQLALIFYGGAGLTLGTLIGLIFGVVQRMRFPHCKQEDLTENHNGGNPS